MAESNSRASAPLLLLVAASAVLALKKSNMSKLTHSADQRQHYWNHPGITRLQVDAIMPSVGQLALSLGCRSSPTTVITVHQTRTLHGLRLYGHADGLKLLER